MNFKIAARTLHRSSRRLRFVPDQQCCQVERRNGYALRHDLRHEDSAIRDDIDVTIGRLDDQIAAADHQIVKRRAVRQDDDVVGIGDQLSGTSTRAGRGG